MRVERLSLRSQAWVRLHFINAMLAPADCARFGYGATIPRAPSPDEWPERKRGDPLAALDFAGSMPFSADQVTWEWANTWLLPLEAGWGSTARLGPPDVPAFLAGKPRLLECWLKLARAQMGYAAWPLVAVGLWMVSVHPALVDWLDDGGWFSVPTVCWTKGLKNALTCARRSLSLHGYAGLPPDAVLGLRQLPAITDRRKEDAAWEEERHRRTVNTPVHAYPCNSTKLSRSEWTQRLGSYLDKFCLQAVSMMVSTLRLEPLDEWWSSRYAWAPGGSSTGDKELRRAYADAGIELPSDARANKKAVFSALPDDYVQQVLRKVPGKYPRASTKHEPGLKQRALYAQDDEGFVISSFPSVAIEKYINFDGVYAQQAPNDVAEWARLHSLYSKLDAVFMSLDYSDFNSDHEQVALARLDLAMAKAWLAVGQGHPAGRDKARCALWSAMSQLNSWVKFPGDEEATRILGGLFSGDRNTARDNCILHSAYSHIMQDAAASWLPSFKMLWLMMTGDDEDGGFPSWLHALIYQVLHAAANFELKPEKQLVGLDGVYSHEYLRRALLDDPEPSRPICPALAQLCSGNWYKTNYVWFDSIISSVNDNIWELHLRGLPLDVAQLAARKILDRAMQVRGPDGWMKLEWYSFRSCGKYSPLWDCTTPAAPIPPSGVKVVRAPPQQKGIDAWMRKNTRRFGHLLTETARRQYERTCQEEAFSSVFRRDRVRAMHKDVAASWPERVTKVKDYSNYTTALEARPTPEGIDNLLLLGYADRHPASEAELVARFGLDSAMLEAIGGTKALLRALSPSDMSQWATIYPQGDRPKWSWYMDPGISSWSREAFRPAAPFLPRQQQGIHIANAPASSKQLHIILAGNASGKTATLFGGRWSRVVDADALLRRAGLLKWAKGAPKTAAEGITGHAAMALARTLRFEQPHAILLQYPYSWFQEAIRLAGMDVASISIVGIPRSVLYTRAASSRFWSPDRVDRREDRFQQAVGTWRNGVHGTQPIDVSYHSSVPNALHYHGLEACIWARKQD